jgi:DHA2 family multidrug resistance protein
VATISLTFGAFFASVVLIPLWLQTSMGYTATMAGYASALNGAFAVVMSPIAARMIGRFDPRALVSFGVLWLAGIAYWRGHFTTDVTFWVVALPFLAQGFALPFFFVPATSISLSAVLPEETAAAAGLQNFLRTTSAAFATSIMTTAWDNTATAKRSELAGRLHDAPAALERMRSAGLAPDQALGHLDRMVQTQAVMLATNQMFIATVAVFVLAAAFVWLAPRPTRAPGAAAGGH